MSSFRRRQMLAAAVSGGGGYIVFADPEVEAICATTFGDGIGTTIEDVSGSIPESIAKELFANNSTIRTFDEFEYFTCFGHISSDSPWNPSTYGLFWNCTNLQSIKLPPNIPSLGNYMFRGTALTRIDIPDSVTEVKDQSFGATINLSLVFRGSVPPSFMQTSFWGSQNLIVYCPYSSDHSVLAAYQTALSGVVSYSALIELNPDGTIPNS